MDGNGAQQARADAVDAATGEAEGLVRDADEGVQQAVEALVAKAADEHWVLWVLGRRDRRGRRVRPPVGRGPSAARWVAGGLGLSTG